MAKITPVTQEPIREHTPLTPEILEDMVRGAYPNVGEFVSFTVEIPGATGEPLPLDGNGSSLTAHWSNSVGSTDTEISIDIPPQESSTKPEPQGGGPP